MRRVRSCYTFDPVLDLGAEVNDKPSVVQPVKTLSLKQLVARAEDGLPVTQYKGIYYNDAEMPDIGRMSKIEIAQAIMDNSEFINLQRQIIQRKNESKDKGVQSSVSGSQEQPGEAPEKDSGTETV